MRGRLFAQLDDHHHGADHLAVWLPAPLGEQEAMVFVDPARFFRPPYVGQRGWVGVRIDRRPDWALVEQAYRQVAPLANMGGPDMAPHTPQRSSRPGGAVALLEIVRQTTRSSRSGKPGGLLERPTPVRRRRR